MDPLHATIEEFAAEGYTYVEDNCPRCRVIRLRAMSDLPRISMGLTLDALARRLRCSSAEVRCCRSNRGVRPMRAAELGEERLVVDFDLFRTQLTQAGFDLHKVEEIYERIREAIETAPEEERPMLQVKFLELANEQAARAKQVLDAHLSAATGSFRPY